LSFAGISCLVYDIVFLRRFATVLYKKKEIKTRVFIWQEYIFLNGNLEQVPWLTEKAESSNNEFDPKTHVEEGKG